MANTFLTKSRHGTVFYFRRRIPEAARSGLGQSMYVQSLATSDRRLAIVRARILAVHTDLLFQRIAMTQKNDNLGDITFGYEVKFDFNELGGLSSLHIKAEPEEQEAVNSAISAALGADRKRGSTNLSQSPQKPFSDAITEYFNKAQIKPQTKATYRSKLDHAQKFFGDLKEVLEIDQANFVDYCEHVSATVPNAASQSHYMTTVATFLNWHRVRSAGLPPLTTKTLVPKRESPESEDRDAFTFDQLSAVFENANQYRRKNPHKFWASVAPAFLGCRIEELCQIHIKTDLVHDVEADIWYLSLDGRPDPDGVVRKSMKVVSTWRHVPIHTSLIRHGFIEFLRSQQQAGFQRPFQKEWAPREATSAFGTIIKWSHYISRWGGRELDAIGGHYGFDPKRLGYFHSMRHTFKHVMGESGVSSEISEALSGRRYGGADAERYEKLKQNHRRLYAEGIEHGLCRLAALFEKAVAD